MRVIYATDKIERQCTSLKVASRLFGGDANLARSLLIRINALREADTISFSQIGKSTWTEFRGIFCD